MKKSSGSIAGTVWALAEPIAQGLGYTLWDVEYVKEGADYYLRIEIDSENGITLDDCEAMHRAIDPVLDEADPIDVAYHLEVSSCGLERELKTDRHLTACIGWQVEVRLYAAVDNAKVWSGTLNGVREDGAILLVCDADGAERAFPKDRVASVRTVYDFAADASGSTDRI